MSTNGRRKPNDTPSRSSLPSLRLRNPLPLILASTIIMFNDSILIL